MERLVSYAGVMAAAGLGALVQGPVPRPSPPPPTPPSIRHTASSASTTIEGTYGPAQPEELPRIVTEPGAYQRKNVIVRGTLIDLVPGYYLALIEGRARVMILPLEPDDYRGIAAMIASDVEVAGIVRVLPVLPQPMVQCLGQLNPQSKCEDPLLPPLPNARRDWPAVSITVTRVDDRGPSRGPHTEGTRDLADTGIDAAAADGKPVRAVGQFRGANLCRDLPEPTRRDPGDWVLLTDEGPVWITGRRPEGRGFRLDPAYRGDVNRWLEVSGRAMTSGQVRYLAAGKVALVTRPPEAETTPCNP